MVIKENMAFALHLFYEGESHYIHKDFGKSTNSPNTTRNMNFALLFALESDARKFVKKNNIIEYQPKFIPLSIREDMVDKTTKKYYNVLERDDINNKIPGFLRK